MNAIASIRLIDSPNRWQVLTNEPIPQCPDILFKVGEVEAKGVPIGYFLYHFNCDTSPQDTITTYLIARGFTVIF